MRNVFKCVLTLLLLVSMVSTPTDAAPNNHKQPVAKTGVVSPADYLSKDKKKIVKMKARTGLAKPAVGVDVQHSAAGDIQGANGMAVPKAGDLTALNSMMESGLLGGGIFFLIGFTFFAIVLGVIVSWKIFEKSGEAGWQALIPFYNVFVMTRIARMPVWSIIILIIPYIGLVGGIWMAINTAKVFGKSTPYAVGLVLLPFFFYPHLAFSNVKYVGGGGTQPPENSPYQMVT